MKKTFYLGLLLLFTTALNAQVPKSDTFSRDVYATNSDGSTDYSTHQYSYDETLYGFVDESGEWLIRPYYVDAKAFSEGAAAVKRQAMGWTRNVEAENCRWGFIDINQKWLIRPRYDDVENFSEGLAAVTKGKKWGFVDKKGKWIIKAKYDDAYSFYEGLAAVSLNGKWGFIDKAGKVIVEPTYDDVRDFHEGFATVKLNGKWGFIDKIGKVITEPTYDNIGRFLGDFSRIVINNKWGFIDNTGKVIVEPTYDKMEFFYNEIARVKLNDSWYLVDRKTMEFIAEPMYDKVELFPGGFARVELNGKWGYVDKTGKVIIKPIYDKVELFSDEIACVELNGRWYLIDKTGEIIVEPKYRVSSDYSSVFNTEDEPLDEYTQDYVQREMNKWQEKGELEKTLEWQQRVNEQSRKQKIIDLTHEAECKYFAERSISYGKSDFKLGKYDADSEIFVLEHRHFGYLLISVPIDKAESFKDIWDSWRDFNYTVVPKYFVDKGELKLAGLTFISERNPKEQFKYVNSAY